MEHSWAWFENKISSREMFKISRHSPSMILLQETKKQELNRKIIRSLCNKGRVEDAWIGANGSTEGLFVLWDADWFSCEEKVIKQRMNILKGSLRQPRVNCVIGNVYAANSVTEKRAQFEEPLKMMQSWTDLWLLGGDFNITLNLEERRRGEGTMATMSEFRNFIEEPQLADLPLRGGQYAWPNNRSNSIYCRLDRFLISGVFPGKFAKPDTKSAAQNGV